ncbi:hypothetical protein QBC43DRAFT_266390 [Cladorrhinum sp. PSN259]|nr:hypothetical protein QBC43DRAFT_266390 [Cladorrhinum sp. PSN259]
MPPKRKATEIENSKNTEPAAPQPAPGPTTALGKRQRVSRACDQCRAAREKCDGVRPQCFPCVSQNRPCTYEVNPKKRGVATGYIRTLELALAWVFDQVPGAEEALNTALAQENGRVRALITGKDIGAADHLHKKWRKSRAHRGIDHILSGSSDTPYPSRDERSPSPDASCTEVEPSTVSPHPGSAMADDTMVPGLLDSTAVTSTHQLQHRKPDRIPDAASGLKPASFSSKRLKLPSNHWRLLDIYFSYTHSWLPILEKQALFQTSYLYAEDGLEISSDAPNSAAHAELWSALALASLQDAACSESVSVETAYCLCPKDIYGIARGLVPSEYGPFQINHARALVLLALVGLTRGDPNCASLLIGSAIRIAFSTTDPPERVNSDKEQQNIQAVLMACFIVETILSVRYNILPHLRDEAVSCMAPLTEDGMDQWEPWTPCEGFGSNLANGRQSRNPAFCISTFNQIHEIFKVVSQDLSARRRGVSARERTLISIGRLQQSLNPNSPFGNLLAPGVNPLVPTFSIIRAIYLWASILADPYSDPPIATLKDTLNQYQKRFGQCSIPSILSACVASLAGEAHLTVHGPQHREQLRDLALTYASTAAGEGQYSSMTFTSHLGLASPSTDRQQDVISSSKFSGPVNPVTAIPYLAAGSFYPNQIMPMSQHPQQRDGSYGNLTNQRLTNPYDHRRSSGSPPPLPRTDSIDMQLGPSVTYRMANVGQNHNQLIPQGFGGNPDYDALLDDLASIECTDAIDVDPQFMTNLGFAPGCDMAEIFTRDFGGV